MRQKSSRLSVLCALVLLVAGIARGVEPAPAAAEPPLIQLAILLDTSGSMDGLINQARTQLWAVVNEMARTRRNGQIPRFQIALYEYGNDGLPAEGGHIRLILPLSEDLDAASEKLFALTTNGGNEYCGWVMRQALDELAWSDSPDAYRVIFIAGNEPFTQGPVNFREVCARAKGRQIIVNTIHCGPEQAGVASGWRDGAVLADGSFMTIDQDHVVAAIPAPQDQKLAELSTALNKTYVPFGAEGAEGAARQMAQDQAVATMAASAAPSRALAKSGAMYRNSSWDLVDALEQKQVKLEEVKEAELPEELRELSLEQRAAHIQQQADKRKDIQAQIQALSAERDKFVAEKQREQAAQPNTLDAAMITAVREQLQGKSFQTGE
jgi:hypothetical protein